MKNIFSIKSPYHKVPDIILEDATKIAVDMFPDNTAVIMSALTSLVNLLRKDIACWTFMLNRAIMDEDEFYLLIQSRKRKLIIIELTAWGLDKDRLMKFADEFSEIIYNTIITFQLLIVTSDNILSMLCSLATK